MIYLSFKQNPRLQYVVIRTSGHVVGLPGLVTSAFRQADFSSPAPLVYTFDDLMHARVLPSLIGTWLTVSFASLALFLSLAGIFAITAFSVQRRSQEFGLRKAVGGQNYQIVAQAMRSVIIQVTVGVGLGILLAIGFSQVLAKVLFMQVSPDARIYALTIAAFMASTTIAALIPATQASRVNPEPGRRFRH